MEGTPPQTDKQRERGKNKLILHQYVYEGKIMQPTNMENNSASATKETHSDSSQSGHGGGKNADSMSEED